jgi:hypothetical protein
MVQCTGIFREYIFSVKYNESNKTCCYNIKHRYVHSIINNIIWLLLMNNIMLMIAFFISLYIIGQFYIMKPVNQILNFDIFPKYHVWFFCRVVVSIFSTGCRSDSLWINLSRWNASSRFILWILCPFCISHFPSKWKYNMLTASTRFSSLYLNDNIFLKFNLQTWWVNH